MPVFALMATVELQQDINALFGDASDADLLCVYQQTDGENGNLAVDALVVDIQRRNLNT
jgi:hypothetical protein